MSDAGVWVKVFPEYAGGGAPGAAVIGGATGSVTESSFTGDGSNGDLGQAYDVYQFTGSGELSVNAPGVLDALVVSGGGSGSSGNNPAGGGGGAGSYLLLPNEYVENDLTVVVGAGGAVASLTMPGLTGDYSRLGNLYGIGGGGGSARSAVGSNGASGGGGSGSDAAAGRQGGSGIEGLGKPGGTANTGASAGGGGAKLAGEDAPGSVAGKGGNGYNAKSFIGSTGNKWLCGGGGGAASGTGADGGQGGGGKGGVSGGQAVEGRQNTGGGGGGGYLNGAAKGGSGIVIVRVKVDSPSFNTRSNTTAPKTAHAARVENGVVRQVIVIPHLDEDDQKITEYCNRIGLPGTWVDTSYTGSRRGKYAGVGDLFDPNLRNAEFVSPEISE